MLVKALDNQRIVLVGFLVALVQTTEAKQQPPNQHHALSLFDPTPQEPISLPADDSMFSTGSDVRRSTMYQRPGPPTPSKHSARLSMGSTVDQTGMPAMHAPAAVTSKPQTQLPEATSKLRAFFAPSKSSSTAAAASRDHHQQNEVSALVVRCGNRANTNSHRCTVGCSGSCYCRYRSRSRNSLRCPCCALHLHAIQWPAVPAEVAPLPSSSLLTTYLLSPLVRFVLALLCNNRIVSLVRHCWHCVCMTVPVRSSASSPPPPPPPPTLMLCCPRCLVLPR